jgi:DNA-binding PadR family transcriptional regulator
MGYKKASTVYLILNKLEKCGLVKSKIEMKNSRSRRVYYTTKKGWSVFEKIKMRVIDGELKEFINALVDK